MRKINIYLVILFFTLFCTSCEKTDEYELDLYIDIMEDVTDIIKETNINNIYDSIAEINEKTEKLKEEDADSFTFSPWVLFTEDLTTEEWDEYYFSEASEAEINIYNTINNKLKDYQFCNQFSHSQELIEAFIMFTEAIKKFGEAVKEYRFTIRFRHVMKQENSTELPMLY